MQTQIKTNMPLGQLVQKVFDKCIYYLGFIVFLGLAWEIVVVLVRSVLNI
jgi:hypothetical protein